MAEQGKEIAASALDAVRSQHPLVHCITNYVTVNDCANALLALDASPIMSDEAADVDDITSICNALVLNIGTLNEATIAGMRAAADRASTLDHPIVLDPVGAGASKLRTKTASQLLDRYGVTILRGNMSEIKALAGTAASTRGVDVNPADVTTDDNLAESAAFARARARQAQVVVAITGAIDVVADANHAFAVRNGSALQGRITGAGCMLSALTGAFAASADTPLQAALGAVVSMGVAGELAASRMQEGDGNGSFRTYLLDALFNLSNAQLHSFARVEEVL
ncbi:hydroxyethylthiazole kinase [Cryptobacterium curtum DSM 15641]|uniref:Hydroxyethylthiazole kinase n=1 Tax=Cryptobacterium curtum (strain ATCC 700683 / DSM 15641 / CCUG 43107 / 12-3) TaxID=469378 RepID=C7MNZ3_CRYCD|nr:hydroxyethylthiazole kinase [Cryptobacterium curtum]ACU94633.1 hydroxyethylthiazole kinase [Cryptobacterium curtum DSM 15641]